MNLGRTLIWIGIVFVGLGVLTLHASKAGVKPFRLPGDIVWRSRNTTVYVPIVTSLLLSLLLTLIFALFSRR